MRLLKLIHTAVFMVMAIVVMAIEPSNIIVSVNGKNYYKHKVESGQTLYALSNVYNVTEQQILDSNVGLDPAALQVGSYILVPKFVDDGQVKRYTEQSNSKSDIKESSKKYIYHEVKAGDTIYSIARRYKILVSILEKDNPDIDIDCISPGMKIRIRRTQRGYATSDEIDKERLQRSEAKETKLVEGEHKVRVGETVYSLSRAYGLTEQEFMELNDLKEFSDLKIGMVVKTRKDVVEQATEDEVDDMLIGGDVLVDSADVATYVATSEYLFPRLERHQTLRVALMLPFHRNGKVNSYMVDLYRGVLIAMQDLKSEGYDINLSVYDTCGSSERIAQILAADEALKEVQLIIGPIYESELQGVLSFAEQNNIPVISPLADIENLRSDVLFQMQAENNHKSDKLMSLFDGSRDIVAIYPKSYDAELDASIREYMTSATKRSLNYVYNRGSFFYQRNADGTNGALVDITELMRSSSSKAFVIVAKEETDVDRILTTLSSTKSSIAGRGYPYGDYVVIGNRKWKQSANIDKQTFFGNNTIFIVPYHANRSNNSIRVFDGRYVTAYDVLPSMYSYRGYDAASIFCRKMFSGIDATIAQELFMPLATPYTFLFEDGLYVNSSWVKEHYKSNFTIEVE